MSLFSPGSKNLEDTFLANLKLIEEVIRCICVANHVHGDKAEEFAAQAKLKLIENDYAILRKFQHKCRLKTYLNVVITRLLIDIRIQEQGKWRPSAEARRSGDIAVELERLLFKDRYSFEEACQILLSKKNTTIQELEEIANRLPHQRAGKEFKLSQNPLPEPSHTPSSFKTDSQGSRIKEEVEETVGGYLTELSGEDRLILKMRFADGFKISEIASFLGIPAKRLYTRIEKILEEFRLRLHSMGIPQEDILEMVQAFNAEIEFGLENVEEK